VTYGYDMERSVDSIRPDHEFDASCQNTVPEAIICTLMNLQKLFCRLRISCRNRQENGCPIADYQLDLSI